MTRLAFAFLIFSAATAAADERWLMVTSACGEQGQAIRCNTFHAPGFFKTEEDCLLRVGDYEAANVAAGEKSGVANVWAWSQCLHVKETIGQAS